MSKYKFIQKAFTQWSYLTKLCAHAFFCSTDGTTIIIQRRGFAGRETLGSVDEIQAEGRRGRGFPPRSTAHSTTLRLGGGWATPKAAMRRTMRTGEGK